ncbi:AraC family transcriptional regulator [Vallitalea okinawensis]|uniref:AraC family transcriptional regulator n=1 Tax=Vallitalea okinawensis TaxID=2078660 RepID=UPI000CFDAB59|nr:AraC family transcriptional regulator [Vallitalea okinawensis]
MSNQKFLIVDDLQLKLPYYLVGVGCHYEQPLKNRVTGIPYFNWIQCEQGNGILEIGEEQYFIKEGQGIFVFPERPVKYYPITDSWLVDWACFQGREVKVLLNNWGIYDCGVYTVKEPELLQKIMRKMLAVTQKEKQQGYLECSLLVYQLLLTLCKNIIPWEKSDADRRRLKPVMTYIKRNYSNIITLQNLADQLGVSPEYICKIFKKHYNKRPMVVVAEYRIAKSKELLVNNPKMTIKDIALQVGYDNFSYFCMIFKKHEGMSPTEYRKLYDILR